MGNMKGILSSDWLSERARWARRRPKAVKKKENINDSRGFTVLQTQLGFWSQIFLPCYKSVTDKACSVKIAGYLPRFFLYAFIGLEFHSFHKNRRKKGNLANIQPSRPHAKLLNTSSFFSLWTFLPQTSGMYLENLSMDVDVAKLPLLCS